jgi:hypothetical protein
MKDKWGRNWSDKNFILLHKWEREQPPLNRFCLGHSWNPWLKRFWPNEWTANDALSKYPDFPKSEAF